MATCIVCGNEYDECFQVLPYGSGEAFVFDSFSAQFNVSHRSAGIVSARSSGTESRSKGGCTAVRTAPDNLRTRTSPPTESTRRRPAHRRWGPPNRPPAHTGSRAGGRLGTG